MNVLDVVKKIVPVAAIVLTAASSFITKAEQEKIIAKEVAKALAEKN